MLRDFLTLYICVLGVARLTAADDPWHHCAVVLNPTIGTTVGDLQFYIDGALDIPLVVTDIERQENGSVFIGWSGSPGEYSLEYTPDLSNPNWFELSDNKVIEAGETTGTSTDSSVATNPVNTRIFYRFRKID
jgi:hypothetical protein